MSQNRLGGVSGSALLVTITGAVLAYSGLKGKSITQSVQLLIQGKNPSGAAQATSINYTPGTVPPGSDPSIVNPGTVPGSGLPSIPGAAGGNMPAITAFLRTKGFNNIGIAGIEGNIQVESGGNTNANNPGEGAIGICQWELGRRTALQTYAASHGTVETDLAAQLGYMWQELLTTHAAANLAVRGAPDPASAATAWDVLFEGSAGTTRGQRIANAQAIYTQLGGHP